MQFFHKTTFFFPALNYIIIMPALRTLAVTSACEVMHLCIGKSQTTITSVSLEEADVRLSAPALLSNTGPP